MDGKPTEILRADSIFRATFVPAGTHRLEFHFRPRCFAWGAAVSLVTLTGCLAYIGVRWRRTGARRFGIAIDHGFRR
jgi:uncharacterized membrane protein YfhO